MVHKINITVRNSTRQSVWDHLRRLISKADQYGFTGIGISDELKEKMQLKVCIQHANHQEPVQASISIVQSSQAPQNEADETVRITLQ